MSKSRFHEKVLNADVDALAFLCRETPVAAARNCQQLIAHIGGSQGAMQFHAVGIGHHRVGIAMDAQDRWQIIAHITDR